MTGLLRVVTIRTLSFPPGTLPAAAQTTRADVRAFLEAERAAGSFVPHCDAWLRGHDPAFSRKLGAKGWIGMTWPKQYGGQERSSLERFVVTEELLAAGAPVAAHWMADRQSGPLLLRFGTEAQRQRFLPPITRGEVFFAIGMSEPDAGSDLASVKTRARPTANGWRLNGQKVWTSHAHHSHFAIVLCRTAGSPEDRHAGLSQLIVDLAAPGVTVQPIQLLDGAAHFAELIFEDVLVPNDMLVGEAGNGWHQVTSELAYERSGPERFMSILPLLFELVRLVGPEPDSRLAEALGRLTANLWTLRSLSLSVATALSEGRLPNTEAAVVKDVGTRFEQEMVETARLLLEREPDPGGAEPVEALLAEAIATAPGFTLRGGTNEILRGIVARALGLR